MHPARRRKKRLGNGLRTVEVARGVSGFGFTISGQQPCILSCIVPGSPAERAGLKAGDYLVTVNGQNVSKASHDDVVRLIGGFNGRLHLQIADNYFSDSSDEEHVLVRCKPKHLHKPRHGTPRQNRVSKIVRDLRPGIMFNENGCDVWNLPTPPPPRPVKEELCFFVGYLGTIEMPKEVQPKSRTQVVRSCIRRLRAEKRAHTLVVMRVHSEGVTLTGVARQILAEYPVSRITFCGSSGDDDKKYVGLVTTVPPDADLSPSSSCHIFAIQSTLVDHSSHELKASAFHVTCTSGVRSETCFEFPGTSEPVLNAVKYFCLTKDEDHHGDLLPSNSPQPSQAGSHAASSNSDSGIGFRDDIGGNSSDRIVMVDIENQRLHIRQLFHGQAEGGQSLDISLPGPAPRSCITPSSNLQQAFAAVSALCPMAGDFDPLQISHVARPSVTNRSRSPLNSSSEDSARVPNRDLSWQEQSLFYREDSRLSATKSSDHLNSQSVDSFGSKKCSKSFDNLSHSKLSAQVHSTYVSPLSVSYGGGEIVQLHPSRPADDIPSPGSASHSCKSIRFQSVDDVAVAGSDHLRSRSLITQSYEGLNSPTGGDRNAHHWGSLQELRSGANQFNRTLPIQAFDRKDGECEKNDDDCDSWATSFEKLLEDSAGLQAFSEFLEKEFSQENIIFWAACERYAKLDDVSERRALARVIFDTHLGENASESVNIDAQAQAHVTEHLAAAPRDLFAPAQKQVFNLMKFDSYPRFVKSSIYQSRAKLTKSRSDAEDSRRKSLLPWARKNRSKSKDRGEFEYNKSKRKGNSVKSGNNCHNDETASMRSEVTSSRSSLASWDLALRGSFSRQSVTSETSERESLPLCRVVLTDGATAVIQVRADETVRELMSRVLAKRGLTYHAFEVFLLTGGGGSGAALPLDEQASVVANCDVRLEQRVVFRLDLPNRKTVSVRAKTSKTLGQVLRPVLHKYNYRMELVTICSMSENEVLDMSMPIIGADGRRLTVLTRSTEVWHTNGNTTDHPHSQLPTATNKLSGPCKTFVKYDDTTKPSLDEITNRVFEEVLNGKQHTIGADDAVSESSRSSTSALPRFLRRDSALIDKLKSRGGRKAVVGKTVSALSTLGKSDSEELYEGLKRAQRSRLEDQRGTEINFELPDFLKDKENTPQGVRKIRKLQDCDNIEEDLLDKSCNGDSIVSNVSSRLLDSRRADEKIPTKLLTCKTYETATSSAVRPTIENSCNASDFANSTLMIAAPLPRKITPPPLPPKPKNLPNLRQPPNSNCRMGQESLVKNSNFLKPSDVKNARINRNKRPVFTEEPSSSFV